MKKLFWEGGRSEFAILQKRPRRRYFPVTFTKLFRTGNLQNVCEWLLLAVESNPARGMSMFAIVRISGNDLD